MALSWIISAFQASMRRTYVLGGCLGHLERGAITTDEIYVGYTKHC